MKKKFAYRRLWQSRLLNRKLKRDVIPIDISLFKKIKGHIGLHGYRRARKEDRENVRAKKIKGHIGLHGYRRARKEDRENVRAYRKDSYGTTLVFIDLVESTIEGKTETWGGLMGMCSDFGLRSYRPV
ncbi:MAG: hypothetical protein ACYS83_12610 [Planctomycetota bacterium]|jgi:hypothetical protein